jgi:16S rRNA (adenine1518-N6/adenine1519-N6)-dimethyltransferase
VTAPRGAGRTLDAAHLGRGRVERYLREHGLAPVRRLSQNHLADGAVLEAIVAEADVRPGESVVEVGPGLGVLTGALLERGALVTAVELDRRLAQHLRRRFAGTAGFRLVEGDFLDLARDAIGEGPWALVANVPYHITSPILHLALGREPRPSRFVLMVQAEVADRIAAAPGAMSYLSVFVQYHADVRVALPVPAEAFEPAPEVDSAVLVGATRPRRIDEDSEERLWRLVQAGFRERRKMLRNVLPRQLAGVSANRIDEALAQASIDPERRPQTLSVEEWIALGSALGSALGPIG